MPSNQDKIAERPSDLLQQILKEMTEPTDGHAYYALTLTATEEGKIVWGGKSGFQGMTDTKPPRELRGTCLVIGRTMLDLWREVGTPGLVVDTKEHLSMFLHIGGNAIIDSKIAEEHFPDVLEPRQVVPTGLSTTTLIENVDSEALKRAPTRKLRMTVLKRDDYRCRICGRRSDDNVDIELHVHHFHPWAMGGLTIEDNLLTLCHTCHNGLDPHFEISLANVFRESFNPLNKMINNLGSMKQDYMDGVRRYREKIRQIKADKRAPTEE